MDAFGLAQQIARPVAVDGMRVQARRHGNGRRVRRGRCDPVGRIDREQMRGTTGGRLLAEQIEHVAGDAKLQRRLQRQIDARRHGAGGVAPNQPIDSLQRTGVRGGAVGAHDDLARDGDIRCAGQVAERPLPLLLAVAADTRQRARLHRAGTQARDDIDRIARALDVREARVGADRVRRRPRRSALRVETAQREARIQDARDVGTAIRRGGDERRGHRRAVHRVPSLDAVAAIARDDAERRTCVLRYRDGTAVGLRLDAEQRAADDDELALHAVGAELHQRDAARDPERTVRGDVDVGAAGGIDAPFHAQLRVDTHQLAAGAAQDHVAAVECEARIERRIGVARAEHLARQRARAAGIAAADRAVAKGPERAIGCDDESGRVRRRRRRRREVTPVGRCAERQQRGQQRKMVQRKRRVVSHASVLVRSGCLWDDACGGFPQRRRSRHEWRCVRSRTSKMPRPPCGGLRRLRIRSDRAHGAQPPARDSRNEPLRPRNAPAPGMSSKR